MCLDVTELLIDDMYFCHESFSACLRINRALAFACLKLMMMMSGFQWRKGQSLAKERHFDRLEILTMNFMMRGCKRALKFLALMRVKT